MLQPELSYLNPLNPKPYTVGLELKDTNSRPFTALSAYMHVTTAEHPDSWGSLETLSLNPEP